MHQLISTEDIDVLILFVGLSNKLACSLYQKSGTQKRKRYIDVCKLAKSLDESVSQVFIGLHTFTGFDKVSAYASVKASFITEGSTEEQAWIPDEPPKMYRL